jgi:hypothetical protein
MAADTLYFNYLIDETYRLLAMEQPQMVNHTSDETLSVAHFSIREVAFSVVYSPLADDDVITVFCDFGSIPEHKELTIYKQLMEINFSLFNRRAPAFCLNPENGHVLFISAITLLHLEPENFITVLSELSAQVADWRLSDAFSGVCGFVR